MSSHTSILKGCNAYFINRLVSRYNRGDEISNIYSDIRIKAVEVVNNYKDNNHFYLKIVANIYKSFSFSQNTKKSF